MAIGSALFILAVGAILRFAVQDSIEGVDLSVVGLILMVIGVIGLIAGIWQTSRFSRTTTPAPVNDPRYDPRY